MKDRKSVLICKDINGVIFIIELEKQYGLIEEECQSFKIKDQEKERKGEENNA